MYRQERLLPAAGPRDEVCGIARDISFFDCGMHICKIICNTEFLLPYFIPIALGRQASWKSEFTTCMCGAPSMTSRVWSSVHNQQINIGQVTSKRDLCSVCTSWISWMKYEMCSTKQPKNVGPVSINKIKAHQHGQPWWLISGRNHVISPIMYDMCIC